MKLVHRIFYLFGCPASSGHVTSYGPNAIVDPEGVAIHDPGGDSLIRNP